MLQPDLADGFVFHARSTPDKKAIVLGAIELSYDELLQRVQLWRVHLALVCRRGQVQAAGAWDQAAPIDYIGWTGENHVHLPALYLACVQSGYCLVLLDPAWPASTRRAILERFRPRCLISPETVLDVGALATPESPCIELPRATPRSWFLLGFTSGSTGVPKAFVRRQQSWIRTFEHARTEFPTMSTVLAPGPLSHGLSFYAMAETLQSGGTFHCLPRFDAQLVQQRLESEAIEALVVVPTMLVAIMAQMNSNPGNTALQRVISAGAKLPPGVRARVRAHWPDAGVSEYYGASELSFVSVSHSHEPAPDASVGRAFAGVEIIIRDPAGRPLEAGLPGEVFVRSDMLADGYVSPEGHLLRLKTTGETVSVGDRGKLDNQGYLFLLDRRDNMIISGGLNVYPQDVQFVLDNHPAILDSIVTGFKDDYWGEKVCAFVRLQAGHTLDGRSFQRYCRERLSTHQVPRRILSIGHWPLTSSGKVATALLMQLANSAPGSQLFGEHEVAELLDA